jgi:type IV pilus assembly protein PilW
MFNSPKAELSSCKNNDRGFTIVELVVGLAIGLIILGVAVKIFLVQQRAYNLQEQLSEMQQNIRSAMDMIVRETKMAGYNPTRAAFDVIVPPTKGIIYDATKTKLQILADLTDDEDTGNPDGDTDDANEDITYTYDPTYLQIKRDTGGGGQPLAENITEFTFDYLNASGDGTSTSTDIRQIEITITGRTAKPDPDLKRVDEEGYRYGTLTTLVTPENLGFSE